MWNKKKILFETEESKKKARPLFTTGEGKKRSFERTTWSKERFKYFHTVEKTCQEVYRNKEHMYALVNGWERWEPDDINRKGKEVLNKRWTIIERD